MTTRGFGITALEGGRLTLTWAQLEALESRIKGRLLHMGDEG